MTHHRANNEMRSSSTLANYAVTGVRAAVRASTAPRVSVHGPSTTCCCDAGVHDVELDELRQAAEPVIPDTGPKAYSVTLSVPAVLAEHLAHTSGSNFAASQPDRFLTFGDGEYRPADAPEFRDGTLMWTSSTADAVLLYALEQQSGHTVTLLTDELGQDGFYGSIVVLTSRSDQASVGE